MAVGKRTRAWLGRIATTLAFMVGLFLLYRLVGTVGWQEIDRHLAMVSSAELVLLLLLPIVTIGLAVMRFWLILDALHEKVPLTTLSLITLAGFALTEVVSGAGITDLVARAVLLGRAGLPTKTALLATTIDGFVRFLVNTVLMAVVSVYLFLTGLGAPGATATLSTGLGVSLVMLVVLVVLLSRGSAAWFGRMEHRLEDGHALHDIQGVEANFVSFFRHIQPQLLIASLVTAAGFFWEPLQVAIILKFFDLDLSLPYWQIFWLYQSLLLPRLLPIPGGLGLSEGSGAFFSALIGQGSSLGVIIGVLARIRNLPYVVLGLLVLPFAGFLKISRRANPPG